MQALELHPDQDKFLLAANIRNALSGIVAGNVKEEGIMAVDNLGPFKISGDRNILDPLTSLLESFANMQRMKISASSYQPCYEIKRSD